MHLSQKNNFTEFIETTLAENNSSLFPGCSIAFMSPDTGLIQTSTTSKIPAKGKTFYSNETLFDIASLTKPIVAVVALRLIDEGKLSLETPIAKFLPVSGTGSDKITFKHLLSNSLELKLNYKLHEMTPSDVRKVILEAPVSTEKPLGQGYYYHNSNALLLGWCLEKYFHQPLNEIVRSTILRPAGMTDTFFSLELPAKDSPRIAPSEECPQRGIIDGKPHDETAYMFAKHSEIVGCAGIFSTSGDMVKFGEFIFSKAFTDPERMLAMMLTNQIGDTEERLPGKTFGLGFDFPPYNYVCGCFSKTVLVHTGFTGCVLWIQPDHKKVLAILSNATFPTRGIRGSESPLRYFRQQIAQRAFYCNHCME